MRLLLLIPLLASVVKAQNINRTTIVDEDSGFKPPFPIECRMIDYDTWLDTSLAGIPVTVRCEELYGDIEGQPVAFSQESLKICMESFTDYGLTHTDGLAFELSMFCNVATLDTAAKKVVMNQYLASRLAATAIIADHDLYRNFQRWVDDTNLRLLDQWESGLYSGANAQQLSQECIQAMGGYWCSKVFPNCTYMLKARWPYNELEEKIYTCKETCEEVLTYCPAGWLPYPIRCGDYVSMELDKQAQENIKAFNKPLQDECDSYGFSVCEGVREDNAYYRREFGGHACASASLTRPYTSGTSRGSSWSLRLFFSAIGVLAYLNVCAS
jgi:hypothetical protein